MLGIPLIPRRTFFENANALNPLISPDGRWLAWLAAADGVMNIWVAPRDDLAKARPLTRQTERPIFRYRTGSRAPMRTCYSLRTRTATRISTSGASGLDVLRCGAQPRTPYRDVLAIPLGMHREEGRISRRPSA